MGKRWIAFLVFLIAVITWPQWRGQVMTTTAATEMPTVQHGPLTGSSRGADPCIGTTPMPFPPHGTVTDFSGQRRVAPFEVVTRAGANYYGKLALFSNPKEPVIEFFVVGGQPFKVAVPVGVYELRYAAGDTWFGKPAYFGPCGSFSKADRAFEFSFTGDGYSGFTVELILQRNGNLSSTSLQAADF